MDNDFIYTCTCLGDKTTWLFAYSTDELQQKVHAIIRYRVGNIRRSIGHDPDEHGNDFNPAFPCACPFQ